jgi:hypothetical protein
MYAKAYRWPEDYLVTQLVSRIHCITEAYGKDYQGRESHIIAKAYQGVTQLVQRTKPVEKERMFPPNSFPELYWGNR